MKKYIIIILVLVSFCQIETYSQTILKKSGAGFCDCYEGTGEPLRMEKFDVFWDENDLPNGKWEDGTFEYYWNTLEKKYYCGCNIGNNAKSVLIKESYWKNGKKHGFWKEYFISTKNKTITKYNNDTLISKKRYTEDGRLFNGKYEGIEFNYAHQKNMVMYIEEYSNGILISGIYYKDEGALSETKSEELKIDFIYKKN